MDKKAQKATASQAVVLSEAKDLAKKGRKAWKVDLKWLFGILATVLLTVSLTSFAVYRVTTNPQVEKLTKVDVKTALPKELQGKIKGTPGQKDFKVNVKGKWYSPEQLDNMSESEMKKLFGDEIEKFMRGKSFMEQQQGSSGQMLGIPGMGGSEQDMEKALSGENAEELGKQMFGNLMSQTLMPALGSVMVGPVKGMSMTIFLVTLIPALLFLALMVVFSYRWGHLLSFALVLFLSALPVFLAASMFKMFSSASAATPKAPGGDPFSGAFSFVKVLADSNFALFLGLLIFAVLLIGLAGLGSIIMLAAKPKPPKKKQPPVPAAPKAA